MEMLRWHSWPGNVRELQSVLKQVLIQATGPFLVPEFLPAALAAVSDQDPPAASYAIDMEQFISRRLQAGTDNLYAEWLSVTGHDLISRVLRHTGGESAPGGQDPRDRPIHPAGQDRLARDRG